MKRMCIFKLISFVIIAQLISWPVFAGGQGWQRMMLPQTESRSSSFRPDKTQEMGAGGMGMPQIPGIPAGMMSPEMQALVYQVHVVGEVQKPGTYRVAASERVSEVITQAGGITGEGSKRHIQVKRKDSKPIGVDLLRFEIFGDLNNNPFVMDNDVVYVPLRKNVVQVVGAVKRPLLYELANERSVKDVIELAGGYNAGVALNDPIRVIRYEGGEKKLYEMSSDSSELSGFSIASGDVVVVPSVITSKHKFDYNVATIPGDKVFYPSYEDRVFVLGGVSIPGAYDWNPYYTVQQYITMAGGITQLAKDKIYVVSADGKKKSMKMKNTVNTQVNPGDSIMVSQRRILPESWVNLFLAVAGFGLSATATVVTLTNR